MSDAEFKKNLLKFGGIDADKGTMYLRGNIRMLGNGSYISQLEVKDMVVTGNAVIPGISFDSLTVAGNVVSTDGNFIGNGALMTGVISTPPPEANIDISGNVVGAYVRVSNITSTSGNIGNVRMSGGNVSASGQVNVRGNVVAGHFIGNGAQLSNVKVSGIQIIDIVGNARGEYANVYDIIATIGTVGGVLMENGNVSASGQVDVIGNVVAGYLLGNGAFLTGILTELPPIANINILGNATGTYANVDQINATLGNIGQVGMAGGDVIVSGQVDARGNVVAGYFIGNGALLTNVSLQPIDDIDIRGNIIGTYANVDNIIAIFGTIGNVTLGNADMQVSGQVDVLGNVAARYFIGNGALLTGVIFEGTQRINIQGNMIGAYANMDVIRANSGNVGNVRMVGEGLSVSGQVGVVGNVTAGHFIGSGMFLTNVGLPPTANSDIRGNVIGTYVNVEQIAATAGNVGNVRMENGNVSVNGTMSVRGNVAAGYFIGNEALIDALYAPGKTSVGEHITVLGNVAGGYFIGNGSLLYDVVAVGIPPIANIDITGNVDGTYVTVEQIVANVGNVGNVRMENGNLAASGQVDARGNVVARNFIGDGALLTNVRTSGVQNIDIQGNVIGNYVDVGQIVAISGNIGNVILKNGNLTTSGQVNVLGNVTANCFIGSGALLTGIGRPSMYLSAAIKKKTLPPSGKNWGDVFDIKMDVLQNRGIVYSQDSGRFTLEGGVTYRITAQLTWIVPSNAGSYFKYTVRNVRTGAQVGISAEALGLDVPGGNTPGTLLDTIFTPRDTDEYVLQTIETPQTSTDSYIPADIGAFLNIVALGGGFSSGFPTTSNVDITGNIDGSNISVDSVVANVIGNIGTVIMSGGNIVAPGQVNVRGNVVAGYFFGNGALLTNVPVIGTQLVNIQGNVDGEYANVANVVAIRGNVGNVNMFGNNVSISGQVNVLVNVTANCFIGAGELVTNAKLNDIRPIDILGNVRSGNNANGGTIVATQGNIANVRMENGNITVPGKIDVTGNVTASHFFGNGVLLQNVRIDDIQYIDIRGNVDGGTYINVQFAEALFGNIGNVTFRERANVVATSGNVGNVIMSRGGISIPGGLNTRANVKASAFIGDGFNMTDVKISAKVINIDIIQGNVAGNYANTANINAIFGNIGNVLLENGNIVANNANIGQAFFSRGNVVIGRGRELNVLGEIHANVFIGNAILSSLLLSGNIPIDINGNILGTYSNTHYANANVAGNIGNVSLVAGNITAAYGNIGNVLLEAGNITAITGNIGNVRMMAGNVVTRGQINVVGNVCTYGNITGNGAYLSNTEPFAYKYPLISNTTVIGNLTGNMVDVQFTEAIIGNIGNVRLNSDAIDVSGQVTIGGNVVAAAFLPRTDIRARFGNIGNIILSGGNVRVAANVHVRGNVSAKCFFGGGANLSNILLNSYISVNSTTNFPVDGTLGFVFKMNRTDINQQFVYTPSTGAYRLQAKIPYRITAQFGLDWNTNFPLRNSEVAVRLYSNNIAESDFQCFISNQYESPPNLFGKYSSISAPIFDVIVVPGVTADYVLQISYLNPGYPHYLYARGSFVNVVSLTGSRVTPLVQETPLVQGKAILNQGAWNKDIWEFTATTSAPTSATSAERKYSWMVTGTTMKIIGYYRASDDNAGATAGTGEYLLQIPGGYRIDDIVSMAPAGDTAGIPIGHLKLQTATSHFVGTVLAYDDTRVKFVVLSAEGAIPIGSDNFSTLSIHTLYFTIDVPIKSV
jgi:hypothetical protein